MALTIYTTYMQDWHNGEAEPLSTHVTERGAKRRLIDYMISQLWGWADWGGQDEIGPWINETLNAFDCAYDEYYCKVMNLDDDDVQELFTTVYDYTDGWLDHAHGTWFTFASFELEG